MNTDSMMKKSVNGAVGADEGGVNPEGISSLGDGFSAQFKTDLSHLFSDKQPDRSDVSLYPPRVHILAVVSSLVVSGLLFLVTAPVLTGFSLLPLSIEMYIGQFTPRVWRILTVVSTIGTICSAIAWYTHSAPPWLRDYFQTSGVIASIPIGAVLLAIPTVIGYYFSIDIGLLALIPAIVFTSYVVYILILPHHQFQQVARTAVSIDESLTSSDFSLLERHGFSIPHRRATARHLTPDDAVNPDQSSVITLNPGDNPEIFAPGYYQAVASFSDTLDDMETARTTVGPLTSGIGSVIAQSDPSRLSTPEECDLASKLASTGASSTQHYATLLSNDHPVEAQQFTDLVESARRSLSTEGPPDSKELETAFECLHGLETSLELVSRINSVRTTWSSETDLNLDEIVDLPAEPAQVGSALLTLDPQVSRAEDLAPLATHLTKFRSTNQQDAAETLGNAVEDYVHDTLTGGWEDQPAQQVVESTLEVGEKALDLVESHSQISFEGHLDYLAQQIRSKKISKSTIQTADDTLKFADDMLKRVSQLQTAADGEATAGFVAEIHHHIEDHVLCPEDPQLSQETLEAAFESCQSTRDLLKRYPEYPYDELIQYLTERLADNSLTEEDIATVKTTLYRSEKLLKGLETLKTSHPSVPADEWRNELRIGLKTLSPQRLKSPLQELKELKQLRHDFWERGEMMAYSPEEFEHVVATLYEAKGYDTTVSEYAGDLGVDVWAHRGGNTVAIQVKQYSKGNTVGREALQKTVSSIAKGDADQAAVVTTSSFANTAENYAEEFGPDLILIDGEGLLQELSELDVPPPTS